MAIKSGQLKEKTDYQAYILEMLRDENGYQVRSSDAYVPGYGMDTELLFAFLEATQKDALTRLEKLYKDKTRQTVLNYINNEINKKNRSLLDVLKHGVEFDNGVTCCVVIASGGYPVSYKSGYVISGLEAAGENALVIHAGTKLNESGEIVTAGGRVLGVVGRCKCLPGAISKAYEAAKKISFTDMHMRSDIGQRALAELGD